MRCILFLLPGFLLLRDLVLDGLHGIVPIISIAMTICEQTSRRRGGQIWTDLRRRPLLIFASVRRNDGVRLSPFDRLQTPMPLFIFPCKLLTLTWPSNWHHGSASNSRPELVSSRESFSVAFLTFLYTCSVPLFLFLSSDSLSSSCCVEEIIISRILISKSSLLNANYTTFSVFLPGANQNAVSWNNLYYLYKGCQSVQYALKRMPLLPPTSHE